MEEITLNINKQDLELILESLCTLGCLDVQSRQWSDSMQRAIDLAIDLRKKHQSVFLSSAFLWTKDTENFFTKESTKELIKYFPELVEN